MASPILFGQNNNKTPPSDNVITETYIQRKGISGNTDYITRNEALCYPAFNRCISLLSKKSAALIAETLCVVDKDGKEIKTETARRAVRLLTESPDGVQTARGWLRELVADYLIEGNALVAVDYAQSMSAPTGRMPVRLTRLDPVTAEAEITAPMRGLESTVYRARDYITNLEYPYPISKIIHARYNERYDNSYSTSSRMFFAPASLSYLQRPIKLGITIELYVLDFFDSSSKSDLVIEFPEEADADDRKLFSKNYKQFRSSRSPLLVFGGAKAKSIKQRASDDDIATLREKQVQEIGRFYGVPSPILAIEGSTWGAGIEQLGRFFWRYSPRHSIYDFLEEFSMKLLPSGQRFEIDPFDEVKGDIDSMTKMMSAGKPGTNNPAIFSRKEIRQKLGMRGDFENDWENWQAIQNGQAPERQEETSDEQV